MAKKKQIVPVVAGPALEGTNGQLMVMAAHRYCLGRRSYIVGACIEWLRTWWPSFDDGTRSVIVGDTIAALMDHEAGDYGDVRDWMVFARWAYEQLSPADQQQCADSLAWKCRPWPLGTWPGLEAGSHG